MCAKTPTLSGLKSVYVIHDYILNAFTFYCAFSEQNMTTWVLGEVCIGWISDFSAFRFYNLGSWLHYRACDALDKI